MIKATGLYCKKCGGRMFTGSQYYTFQKNYIDLTCSACAYSVDIEVKKLNVILNKLGFKAVREYYDFNKTSNK